MVLIRMLLPINIVTGFILATATLRLSFDWAGWNPGKSIPNAESQTYKCHCRGSPQRHVEDKDFNGEVAHRSGRTKTFAGHPSAPLTPAPESALGMSRFEGGAARPDMRRPQA